MLRRYFNTCTMPPARTTYWRLLRYMLYAFLAAAFSVGGVFLCLAMRWPGLAGVCGLTAIGGIASGFLLNMAQTANVIFWSRPDAAGGEGVGGEKAEAGRRMSAGRLLSPSEISTRLEANGRLHDSTVSIKWFRGLSDRLVIHVYGLGASVRDLPECRGKRSGELTFMDARDIDGSFAEGERKVLEATVKEDGERGRVTLLFWPTGSLVASFSTATLIESGCP